MAEGGPGVSSLPLPPMQYVNLFTDENVKRGRLPLPPPPIQEGYSMFGQPISHDDAIIQSLESQGLKRLYPQSYDHKRELKKLNHSILVNYLDLLDIFIKCPESQKRTEKIQDINLLFIHMHHLVNEYRPHQARETLRVMLEFQKRNRLETIDKLTKHLCKVQELVRTCVQHLPEPDLDNKLLVNIEGMNVVGEVENESEGREGTDDRDILMTAETDDL